MSTYQNLLVIYYINGEFAGSVYELDNGFLLRGTDFCFMVEDDIEAALLQLSRIYNVPVSKYFHVERFCDNDITHGIYAYTNPYVRPNLDLFRREQVYEISL